MKVNLSFSGWLRDVDVTKVYCPTSNKDVNVEDIPTDTVIEKLLSGEWTLSLATCLEDCEGERRIDIKDLDFPYEEG